MSCKGQTSMPGAAPPTSPKLQHMQWLITLGGHQLLPHSGRYCLPHLHSQGVNGAQQSGARQGIIASKFL
jgi:hypothetical protein